METDFGSSDFVTGLDYTFKGTIGSEYSWDYMVVEQPSFTTIDGQKAGTFVYSIQEKYETDPVQWGVQDWIVYVRDHGYSFQFASKADKFDTPENTQIRNHVIQSIKFLGVNNQTISNATNGFG